MNRLRNRLIAVFLAATLVPLGATWWLAASLLERSLSYSTTRQVDRLSRTLEHAGRELYQRERESLKQDAAAERVAPRVYLVADATVWPSDVREFWDGNEAERFALAEPRGSVLEYFVRAPEGVRLYSRPLGFSMAQLASDYRDARAAVERASGQDLRRGFLYTFALLAASMWAISLALLTYLAYRISRPIQELTAALARLAAGDLSARVETKRDDEIGRAVQAFNHMAAELEHSRDRLVYLTQLASWQLLARKMAHELKNSLTPIRLTMEEVLARRDNDPGFMEQAARIVVDEAESLERRVRAFSEFSAEPPVRPAPLDINAAVEERVAFLKTGHPEVIYTLRLADGLAQAQGDDDLVRGILTNLLENGAEAAGAGGAVLITTAERGGQVAVEVHDSGPGLGEEARRSLFEPTISFKKRGMGLGLSIARKNALLQGGDIALVEGELGGAGFRVTLPRTAPSGYQLSAGYGNGASALSPNHPAPADS